MRELAAKHPRFGYRRIHQLLLRRGWRVNHKRVQRLWRREGMRVPRKRRKRARIGDSSNSCTRRRPEAKDHVWSYDFLFERTEDGRQVKVLAIVDEYTRECPCTHAARSITAEDVIGVLASIMVERGVPQNIRSDNGPVFVAEAIRCWLGSIGVSTLFIGPGAPWENAYIESFNARLRDELLNGELFTSLAEARYLLERWRARVQHREAPQQSRPTDARGVCGELCALRLRFAPSPGAQPEDAEGTRWCRYPLNPATLKSTGLVSGGMPVDYALEVRVLKDIAEGNF